MLNGKRKGWTLLAVSGLLCLTATAVWSWQKSKSPAAETATVGLGDIEVTVAALGAVHPRRFVDIGAQVSGQITHLAVQAGDVVSKGQLLVEIDPSLQQSSLDASRAALAGLKARLADQQAQHELARLQHARQQVLAPSGATPQQEVQIAEATLKSASAKIDQLRAEIEQTSSSLKGQEAQLGYTRIYAPMAGTVVSLEVKEGQTLNATYQTPTMMRVADLSTMTVWTEVSEADVRRIKTRMPVHFTTLGGDGRRWAGQVRQLLPAPPVSATLAGNSSGMTPALSKVVLYTVLFDVDNADGELMPQMTAQVSFVVAAAKGTLTAPLMAMTPVEGRRDLYRARVRRPKGEIDTVEVRLGVRDRLKGQVLAGLEKGDQLLLGEAVSPTARP